MKTIIAATIVATGFIVAGYLVRQPSRIIIERKRHVYIAVFKDRFIQFFDVNIDKVKAVF